GPGILQSIQTRDFHLHVRILRRLRRESEPRHLRGGVGYVPADQANASREFSAQLTKTLAEELSRSARRVKDGDVAGQWRNCRESFLHNRTCQRGWSEE